MKKSSLKIFSILISLLFIIHYFDSIQPRSLNTNKKDIIPKLKNQQTLDITILINGTAKGVGAHNWTWASSQEWCTGNGTSSDPFLIENISISHYSIIDTVGIDIINSVNHFIIKNCTFYRFAYGIIISNSTNGKLFNNTINYCYEGITITESQNFNISLNFFRQTNIHVFYLENNNNITISKNKVVDIGNYGIYCINNLNLNLIDNIFDSIFSIYVLYYILFANVNESSIIRTIGFSPGYDNIVLQFSNNNSIKNNSILSYQHNSRISLYKSSYNTISNNKLIGDSQGIILAGGSCNNRILYNNISHIHDGIKISQESNNNLIILNQIKYNISDEITDGNGITISESNFNNILNNTLKNNKYGIELIESNYNIIKYNQITEYSSKCILEISCQGNIITNNYCSSSIAPSDNDNGINWYFSIFIFIGLGLLAIFLITKIKTKK
ncbi:MAG: NosD domain-containing protein [Candidatus Odinarchaeota archaeon]